MARRKDSISDLGEKIGGARKDLSAKTGPRRKAGVPAADQGPAWARRYLALQNSRTGKWDLVDTGKSGPYGGHRTIARDLATEAEAKEAIPLAAVSRNHRVRETYNLPPGEKMTSETAAKYRRYQIWREVSDRKRVQVVSETFASRDEAMRYMAQNAAKIIDTKTAFGEEILARPEKVYRAGPSTRAGDIAGKAFLNQFGFRGVEFGNWQSERQSVMNHAYDAMRDLESVTGVDSKALSLKGELGLAFGARGHGGKDAARAHYERDYGAINLTKMRGAGTLAHEWWHAADHLLGRLDDPKLNERVERQGSKVFKTAGREDDYGSHRVGAKRSGQMPEAVRKAYAELMDAMFTKPEQYTEDTVKTQKFAADTGNRLTEKIATIRRGLAEAHPYAKKGKPATVEQLARFDALAAKITDGDLKTTWQNKGDLTAKLGARGSMIYRHTNDTLEAMNSLLKEVRGRSGFDSQHRRGALDDLATAMSQHEARQKMVADAAAQSVKTRNVPTSFAMEAKKIDQGRLSDYWTTRHEMAARAFSSYVEDKLAASGRRSDYLSYGSTNDLLNYRILGVKPFPEGAERQRINAAFDNLFAAMRESEVLPRSSPTAANVHAAMATAPSNERVVSGHNMPETVHEDVRGVPTQIRPGADGDPFKYKSKWHETVEWDSKGYPGKTTIVHAATLEEYESKLRAIDEARVKAGQQPRHVWDDKARAASAEARVAKAEIGHNQPRSVVQDVHPAADPKFTSIKLKIGDQEWSTSFRNEHPEGMLKHNIGSLRETYRQELARRFNEAVARGDTLDLKGVKLKHFGDGGQDLDQVRLKPEHANALDGKRETTKGSGKRAWTAKAYSPDKISFFGQHMPMTSKEAGVIAKALGMPPFKEVISEIDTAVKSAVRPGSAPIAAPKAKDSATMSAVERAIARSNEEAAKRKPALLPAPPAAVEPSTEQAKPASAIRQSGKRFEVLDNGKPILDSKGKPKWFGSKGKAEAFLAKRQGTAEKVAGTGLRGTQNPNNLAAIVEGKKAAASSRYITLGDGRKVTLGQYVDAWKNTKAMDPNAEVRGAPGAPDRSTAMRAKDALAQFRAGLDDRINQKDPNFGKGRKWDDAWQNEARRLAETLKRKSEVPSGEAHPVDLRAKIKDRLAPGTTVPAPGGDRSKAKAAKSSSDLERMLAAIKEVNATKAGTPEGRAAEARLDVLDREIRANRGWEPHWSQKPAEISPNATARMIGIPKDGSRPFLMAILDSAGDKRQIAERVWNQSAKMHTQPLAGYRIEDKAGNRLHGFQDESTLNAALKAQGKAEKGKAKPNVPSQSAANKPTTVAKPPKLGKNSGLRFVGTDRTLERGPVNVYMSKSGTALVGDVNAALDTDGRPLGLRQAPSGIEMAAAKNNKDHRFHATAQRASPDSISPNFKPAKPSVSDLRAEAKAAGIKGAAKMTKSALMNALGKVGAVALVAAPVTAAVLAYDAKKSEAQAAGATSGSATGSALTAGAIAGGTTAAVGYGVAKAITWGVRGAAAAGAAVGAPVLGTVAAGAATVAGAYMMAKGAVHGYQKHGAKGAVLGLVGADGLLDRKTTPAAQPVNGRLSAQQAVEFSTANAAYSAMQKAPANSAPMVTEHGRGFGNVAVQRAAQKAQGRVYDPARKIAAAGA